MACLFPHFHLQRNCSQRTNIFQNRRPWRSWWWECPRLAWCGHWVERVFFVLFRQWTCTIFKKKYISYNAHNRVQQILINSTKMEGLEGALRPNNSATRKENSTQRPITGRRGLGKPDQNKFQRKSRQVWHPSVQSFSIWWLASLIQWALIDRTNSNELLKIRSWSSTKILH